MKKPHSGIYSDEDLMKALNNLETALNEFIPEHVVGAHLRGTTARLVAKAKCLVNLAKNVEYAAIAVKEGTD